MTKEILERLAALVEARRNALPPFDYRDDASWKAHDRALEKIRDELTAQEGAVFTRVSDAYALRMAGVRATCTGGYHGLLANWKNAALRKIEKMEAVDVR